MEDFQKMFRELETIIALKIRQNPEVDTKSINQIMIAYSKTMNFSKEFLYFLEQVCLENFDKFDPQETSNILYSFSKNRYESKGLLDKLGFYLSLLKIYLKILNFNLNSSHDFFKKKNRGKL